MSFEDKSILCCECRKYFVFTAGEQQFHASKGFTSEPVRCSSCRAVKKMQRYGDNDYSYRSRTWR